MSAEDLPGPEEQSVPFQTERAKSALVGIIINVGSNKQRRRSARSLNADGMDVRKSLPLLIARSCDTARRSSFGFQAASRLQPITLNETRLFFLHVSPLTLNEAVKFLQASHASNRS